MAKDLRTFLEQVRELGPEFYVEVSKKLSPELEVPVIQEKLVPEGRYPVYLTPHRMMRPASSEVI